MKLYKMTEEYLFADVEQQEDYHQFQKLFGDNNVKKEDLNNGRIKLYHLWLEVTLL